MNHRCLSLIKSFLRILGLINLIFLNFIAGFSLLVLAEILGIIEEYVSP